MARPVLRLASFLLAGAVVPAAWPFSVHASAAARLEFSIVPRLCILSAHEAVCEHRLAATWVADIPMSLCLFQDGNPAPLKCWKEADSGRHTLTVSAGTDLRFYLEDGDGGGVLASRVLKVVHDDRRYRRRVRNPWSFF